MDGDDLVKIASGIVEHMKRGRYERAEIHVIGGEPTMLGLAYYEAVVPRLRAVLEGHDFTYDLIIVSNLLSADIVSIAKLFDRINTSWEIGTRFPKAKLERRWEENVRLLLAEGLDVGVTTAVTKPVIAAGAAHVLDHLYALGLRQMHFGFFIPSGDGKDNIGDVFPRFHETSQFMIDATDWYMARRATDPALFVNPSESMLSAIHDDAPLDDIICPIVSGSMDIDPDGKAGTCLEAGGEVHARWLGNVLATSVAEVAESASFRREVVVAARPKKPCLTCDEFKLCKAGCSVNFAYWTPEDQDCPGFKSFIKHVRALHGQGARPKYADYRNKFSC
jgi:radical SAM protein with 4Fe4S-binding SPASM domain